MLDKTISSTLKRNPKMELNKTDLLKLLSYLEGELQARDVVIAALKSEKVKQVLQQARYRPLALNDPYSALFRDSVTVCVGNSKYSHTVESDHRPVVDQQMESLENLVLQQRQTQLRMAAILKDAEEKHKKIIQELEDEKRKHEHDTAQGDDITYGLEMERTRLKQELESEKQAHKKLEKDLKKQHDVFEEERGRHKQIVLLLLAERKKIIMKYIEERKRSEDLAQILSEEKLKIDSMAEGLEEESKKSLSMEADLEKQQHLFETEKKALQVQLLKEEKRARDIELELAQVKAENESLRKALESGVNNTGNRSIPMRIHQNSVPYSVPQLPSKLGRAMSVSGVTSTSETDCIEDPSATGSSVAKVVQPTATVSSVPVCGPTTGIARSISPGQGLRLNSTLASPGTSSDSHLNAAKASGISIRKPPNASPTALPSKSPVLAQPLAKKGVTAARGIPPPIPPNKPVVPPKRDTVTRLFENSDDPKKSKDKRPRAEPASDDLTDIQHMLVTMTNKT
ncbi:uncharacterized protein CG10915 [Ctenocephalides felis]|uniref:uncharacterized protein CG10915 n=1 Tax=Ctenocephalides felis TaxID=7515 RepID=UPI000E6E4B7F|nr:uncharacterized protein CG10915 [Ctenocephalides felis]